MISLLLIFFVLCVCWGEAEALSSSTQNTKAKHYNYFAFGSNMASTTMTALRNVSPIASTAAVVPNHRLAFNVPGAPLIEPSWASIETSEDDVCHGVLYKLTEEDFRIVCETEGVPFGYTLHRCRVIPYKGNGEDAGRKALDNVLLSNKNQDEVQDQRITNERKQQGTVAAFTLRASRKEWRNGKDIPPSRAYLNVLIRGAEEFKIDGDYLEKLRYITPGRTVGNGMAETMLEAAERRALLSSSI